ncbi:DNA-directed RNA polymerase I subunit RPA34 [Perognathus longimembris pacificus]|uniref:DNA-directed RNA polymerase I subunit RPA34 n=1 Tax=Perognathus longimembris pacificus TaxID=214514 RepID=UPI00201996D8|nr:DNA-directed RNA polymerase I subunit RPA34 [Perognathus longimembris pacificus]
MAGTPAVGAARFSCPPNFIATTPASDPPHFSLETLTGPDTELWLIQTPADFVPNSLDGRRVPLSGSRIVKGKLGGQRHRYHILSSSGSCAGAATLLAPSTATGGELTCAPVLHGSLKIMESPQESLPGTPLQPILASPPPQIPPGLRPRFCAFGGNPPVTGPGSALTPKSPTSKKKRRQAAEAAATPEAVNGHGTLEVDTAGSALETDVGRKKKKRKKQHTDMIEPAVEVLEPEVEVTGLLGGLGPGTPKKWAPEAEMAKPEEKPSDLKCVLKTEPPEETALPPTKKRKRPKGARGMELAVEGAAAMVDSQPQVEVEAQEEAISPPPRKKIKKEKRQPATMEPETEGTEPQGAPLGLSEYPEVEPKTGTILVPPKKKKKKEKLQNVTVEASDPEPQATVASPKKKKKKKKDRGHTDTDRTDITGEHGA